MSHGHDSTLVKKSAGKLVNYRFTAKADQITGRSCSGAGHVSVRGRSYRLERCRRTTSHYAPATVNLSFSKEEAGMVDFEAGDEALVIFEPMRIGGSARLLNLGHVRIVRVEPKARTRR